MQTSDHEGFTPTTPCEVPSDGGRSVNVILHGGAFENTRGPP